MKKLLILFVLLLNGMSAIYGFTVDGISYETISSEEVKVIQGDYSGQLVLPSTVSYDGKEYVVTYIGRSAFYGCSCLTSVTIPNSVTSIGSSAFYGCTGLTEVTIPNSVTSIGGYAFFNCSSLTEITIPNSVTSIENYAFSGCTGLTSITIPNSVTSIEWGAFSGCSGLTAVTIPNSVTSIGYYAFSGCSGLTEITIPNSVTYIGGGAFYNCSGLTAVTIPNSVTNIEDEAFSGCSSLTSIRVERGNTQYDSRNDCNAIIETNTNTLIYGCQNTVIPNTVTSIGNGAFSGCSGLTAITIPNSVTRIGYAAFSGCSSLTSITIPKSVTTIEEVDEEIDILSFDFEFIPEFFFGCSSLTEIIVEEGNPVYDSRDNCNAIIVTSTNTLLCGCNNTVIPNSVNTIGKGAFHGCTKLTSVTIPNSVTRIERSAFRNCTGLTSLFISKSVRSIAGSAFDHTSGGCYIVHGAFYGCTGLVEIIVEEGNPVYDSRDNCNAIIVTSTNTLLFGCNNTIIPNSTTSIGMEAFSGCSGLTTVTIPSSVTSIGEYAFSGSSALTTVTIPSSVARVGEYAFSGCSALTTVITQMRNPPTIFTEYSVNMYYPNPGDANTVFSNRANAVLYVRKGCKETYENASGWDFGEIIELTDATITISSAGVATYCPDGDLDFTDVDGLKAYIATAYDTQTHDVTMMRVYDVPAGTGLYLKGEAGTYTLPYTTSYSYYVNLLKGTFIPITLAQKEGNMTNFILSNGASGIGFYPLSKNGPFGANKAYLQVPTGTTYQGAKMLNLVFEESESTDIQEITADNGDDSYYSLTGVKVERPSKGIYIYKGKKVLIK